MTCLIDTHTFLWFVLADPRLSHKARELVGTSEVVYVCPASYWEIGIKISLGKYHLPEPFAAFMERELKQNDFTILPITIAHASKVSELPFHHRDPFDRMIVAQALVENIPLVSCDNTLDAYGVTRIW